MVKMRNFVIYTNSFIVHVNAKYIYKDIAEDVETRFDTSNYELERPLPKRKKSIGLMNHNQVDKS